MKCCCSCCWRACVFVIVNIISQMLLVAFTQVININAKCHVYFFVHRGLFICLFVSSFVCLTVCDSFATATITNNIDPKNNILLCESMLHVVYFVFLKTKLMHVNTNVNISIFCISIFLFYFLVCNSFKLPFSLVL